VSRQKVWGPILLAPALILLIFLYIVPFFYSVYQGFNEVGIRQDIWVGLDNYYALFRGGDLWDVIRVTGKILIAYLTCSLVVAFILGVTLSQFGEKFRGAILTLYRFPSIFTGLTTLIVWRWFFRYPDGGINRLLNFFHLPGRSWLGSPTTAIWALCLVMAVPAIGGRVLLYVISISQIDKEILEAARMDGANQLQIIWYIITPLTQRLRLYIALTSTIGVLNIWEHPFLYTGGGPLGSTTTIMYKIYHLSLIEGKFGMGNALTTVVVLGALLGSFVIVRILRVLVG